MGYSLIVSFIVFILLSGLLVFPLSAALSVIFGFKLASAISFITVGLLILFIWYKISSFIDNSRILVGVLPYINNSLEYLGLSITNLKNLGIIFSIIGVILIL